MARPLLLDGCIATTFGAADRLDLITGIGERRVLIAAAALEEVRRPPARDRLRDAVQSGRIEVEGLSLDRAGDWEALVRYESRPAFRGRADAEVLALAELRGYEVASDERAMDPWWRRWAPPASRPPSTSSCGPSGRDDSAWPRRRGFSTSSTPAPASCAHGPRGEDAARPRLRGGAAAEALPLPASPALWRPSQYEGRVQGHGDGSTQTRSGGSGFSEP
jgi:hypothetical protein